MQRRNRRLALVILAVLAFLGLAGLVFGECDVCMAQALPEVSIRVSD